MARKRTNKKQPQKKTVLLVAKADKNHPNGIRVPTGRVRVLTSEAVRSRNCVALVEAGRFLEHASSPEEALARLKRLVLSLGCNTLTDLKERKNSNGFSASGIVSLMSEDIPLDEVTILNGVITPLRQPANQTFFANIAEALRSDLVAQIRQLMTKV